MNRTQRTRGGAGSDPNAKAEPFSILVIAERVFVGVAASSGLIVAACLAGLPSVSCTALAQTYVIAVLGFGSAAFGAVFALGVYTIRWRTTLPAKIVPYFYLAGVIALFFGAVLSSNYNIRIAEHTCFEGTAAELSANLHRKVPTLSPLEAWRVFVLPKP